MKLCSLLIFQIVASCCKLSSFNFYHYDDFMMMITVVKIQEESEMHLNNLFNDYKQFTQTTHFL